MNRKWIVAVAALMISTLVIVRPRVEPASEKNVKSLLADFTAGNRFIFTHSSLAFVMLAMLSAMFVMSCFSPLISFYVRAFLQAVSFMFGIVSALVGVGRVSRVGWRWRRAAWASGRMPRP